MSNRHVVVLASYRNLRSSAELLDLFLERVKNARSISEMDRAWKAAVTQLHKLKDNYLLWKKEAMKTNEFTSPKGVAVKMFVAQRLADYITLGQLCAMPVNEVADGCLLWCEITSTTMHKGTLLYNSEEGRGIREKWERYSKFWWAHLPPITEEELMMMCVGISLPLKVVKGIPPPLLAEVRNYVSWLRLRKLYAEVPKRAHKIFKKIIEIVGKRKGMPPEKINIAKKAPPPLCTQIVDETIEALGKDLVAYVPRGTNRILVDGKAIMRVWERLPPQMRHFRMIKKILETVAEEGKAFVSERGEYILERKVGNEFLRIFLNKVEPGKFALTRVEMHTTQLALGKQPWLRNVVPW